jgi:hypothetical protein
MARFVLNFQRQFVPAIMDGTKLQTIRRTRADGKRPLPGDIAALYTGLRTRSTQHLRDGQITRCRAIRIDLEGAGELIVDSNRLTQADRLEFAKADGFPDWPAMHAWFKQQYPEACAEGGAFEGFCVEWKV